MDSKMKVNFILNGEATEIEAASDARLLDVLRDDLGLIGTKEGCGVGECGACTVIMDGETVNSCLVLACSVEGRTVETIENLSKDGKLHPVQEAFIEHNALQCGFCIPGLVNSGKNVLDKNKDATREEIKLGISGNLCRCTGYEQVLDAIETARDNMNKK